MLKENFNLESASLDRCRVKKAPFSIKKSYYKEDEDEKALPGIDSGSLTHDKEQAPMESALSSPQANQCGNLTTENYDDLIRNKQEMLPAEQDATASANYSYGDYLYGQPMVPLELCPKAGLRLADAQAINAAIVRGKVAVSVLHEMNREKFSYMTAMDSYKRQCAAAPIGSIDETNQAVQINVQKNRLDFKEFERLFIQNFAVVKVRPRYSAKLEFMKRSSYYHRHEVISEKDLFQEYLAFLDDVLPSNDESSPAVKEQSFQRMKRAVPRLQDSGLYVLKECEVMFNDGIYNVETGEFHPVKQDEHIFCFNIFSIEIDYGDGKADMPEVFDAFLDMILDGDELARHGTYQMIGSILTPMSSIKKCYLLQGKSGSGKTTLIEYIKKLMPYEDTLDMPNLSGIADDGLGKRPQPFRLIHVKELSSNKLSAKQIVNIKAYADGSNDMPGTASFKIMLTTNHKVTTGDGGVIETALKNRLLTIPFPKLIDLNSADPRVVSLEDIYFERERRGIILKALQAYREVLENRGIFCCDFEVNAVVDEPEKPGEHLSAGEKERIQNGLPVEAVPMLPALAEAFDSTFVLVDEINPQMTSTAVMNAINAIRPSLLENEPTTGRKLKQHFGERLKSRRLGGNTAYNLSFARPNAETASNTAE